LWATSIVTSVSNGRQPSPGVAAELAGVNKWYEEFRVLRDIDLTVLRGERVVLWGRSGSGKTTLLRCLAGLEAAQSGTMHVAGKKKTTGALARPEPTTGVGMVFQKSALFLNMRVIDNLTIGLRSVRKMARQDAITHAMNCLDQVQMTSHATQFPAQLSGGQQQRAEIARALCMDPQILLFDEPTAALDPELKHEVGGVIERLAQSGRTIIVATHEADLVRALAPRMILMEDGAIVGESSANDYFVGRAR
jgi:general L-amino acid transport system ATP-binding protein